MKTATLKLILAFAFAVGPLLMVACATLPATTSDYDRSADFAAYRSFGFFESPETDAAGYESLVTHALQNSARRQMEARGYVYADNNAELLINFSSRFAQSNRVTHSRTPLYGYGSGVYGGWDSSMMKVEKYVEGTIKVDIIDAKRRQMVWEGIAVGWVDDTQHRDRAAAIDAVVVEIFAQFPFRAGA